ncbi:MAG: hypothetical protein QGG40_14295, partial [Myxococcota bacterium]|nr:hypothetical protein [Myxococcota bacterium]
MPRAVHMLGLTVLGLTFWAWQKDPPAPSVTAGSSTSGPKRITTRMGGTENHSDSEGDAEGSGPGEGQGGLPSGAGASGSGGGAFGAKGEGGIGTIGGDPIILGSTSVIGMSGGGTSTTISDLVTGSSSGESEESVDETPSETISILLDDAEQLQQSMVVFTSFDPSRFMPETDSES